MWLPSDGRSPRRNSPWRTPPAGQAARGGLGREGEATGVASGCSAVAATPALARTTGRAPVETARDGGAGASSSTGTTGRARSGWDCVWKRSATPLDGTSWCCRRPGRLAHPVHHRRKGVAERSGAAQGVHEDPTALDLRRDRPDRRSDRDVRSRRTGPAAPEGDIATWPRRAWAFASARRRSSTTTAPPPHRGPRGEDRRPGRSSAAPHAPAHPPLTPPVARALLRRHAASVTAA